MLIEILYVPGCPNYQPTLGRIREALRSQSVEASIAEIAITDESMARALSFPGSPTVRINGEDIETTVSSTVGLACRLYAGQSGIPSEEALRSAVLRVHQRGRSQ